MGGGSLPVAFDDNTQTLYFLFGKQNHYLNNKNPGWSDFGGKEKHSETAFDAAVREGHEELNGFIGNSADIKHNIRHKLVTSFKHETYITFLFKIEYDPNLPSYFNNNFNFLSSHVNLKPIVQHPINGLFEKSEIKWMTIDDIRKNKHLFREFYQNIIDIILKNTNEIIYKIKRINNNKHTLKNTHKLKKKKRNTRIKRRINYWF
jgi:hypothetical protein